MNQISYSGSVSGWNSFREQAASINTPFKEQKWNDPVKMPDMTQFRTSQP